MKRIRALGLALALTTVASCLAGPHQTRRSVDDFDHRLYVQNPWLNALLWVVPVFPVLYGGAFVVDFFVVDFYHFWFNDAWKGSGTGFERYTVESDRQVRSLLHEDARFLDAESAGRRDALDAVP